MRHIDEQRLVAVAKSLTGAILATALGLIVAFVFGLFVPMQISGGPLIPFEDRSTITLEEGVRAREDAVLRAQEQLHQTRARPFLEHLHDVQRHAWAVAWVPWIFVPLFVRVSRLDQWLAVLALPVALLVAGAMPVVLFVVSVAALLLSSLTLDRIRSRERAT